MNVKIFQGTDKYSLEAEMNGFICNCIPSQTVKLVTQSESVIFSPDREFKEAINVTIIIFFD
jgi:hypothetical protein